MKCPKCGSEMYVKMDSSKIKGGVHYVTEKDYSCYDKNCSNNETYQQRLERVLSKFEPETDKYYSQYTYKELDWSLAIVWNGMNFLFSNSHGSREIKISLDTVESLLKDLEK